MIKKYCHCHIIYVNFIQDILDLNKLLWQKLDNNILLINNYFKKYKIDYMILKMKLN